MSSLVIIPFLSSSLLSSGKLQFNVYVRVNKYFTYFSYPGLSCAFTINDKHSPVLGLFCGVIL
jgi:hypothetical protein